MSEMNAENIAHEEKSEVLTPSRMSSRVCVSPLSSTHHSSNSIVSEVSGPSSPSTPSTQSNLEVASESPQYPMITSCALLGHTRNTIEDKTYHVDNEGDKMKKDRFGDIENEDKDVDVTEGLCQRANPSCEGGEETNDEGGEKDDANGEQMEQMKAPYSYNTLTTMPFENSPQRHLRERNVCDYTTRNYPHFSENNEMLLDSVQGPLSGKKCYVKVVRHENDSTKENYCVLDAGNNDLFVSGPSGHERNTRRSIEKYVKPPFTYNALIAMAIARIPNMRLTTNGIFDYIMENYPYYRKYQKMWQQCVRNALDKSDVFIISSCGMNDYWVFNDSCDNFYIDGNNGRLIRKNDKKFIPTTAIHLSAMTLVANNPHLPHSRPVMPASSDRLNSYHHPSNTAAPSVHHSATATTAAHMPEVVADTSAIPALNDPHRHFDKGGENSDEKISCGGEETNDEEKEHEKPPFTYKALIAMAIANSPDMRLTTNGIFSCIMKNYPYYRKNQKMWQQCVRMTLYKSDVFMISSCGMNDYWVFNDSCDNFYIDGSNGRLIRKNDEKFIPTSAIRLSSMALVANNPHLPHSRPVMPASSNPLNSYHHPSNTAAPSDHHSATDTTAAHMPEVVAGTSAIPALNNPHRHFDKGGENSDEKISCGGEETNDEEKEHEKPPFTYKALIAMAIANSPDMRLTTNGIFSCIMKNYPYYRKKRKLWQTNVRYCLKTCDFFIIFSCGIIDYWTLDDSCDNFYICRDSGRLIRKNDRESLPTTATRLSAMALVADNPHLPHSRPVMPALSDPLNSYQHPSNTAAPSVHHSATATTAAHMPEVAAGTSAVLPYFYAFLSPILPSIHPSTASTTSARTEFSIDRILSTSSNSYTRNSTRSYVPAPSLRWQYQQRLPSLETISTASAAIACHRTSESVSSPYDYRLPQQLRLQRPILKNVVLPWNVWKPQL